MTRPHHFKSARPLTLAAIAAVPLAVTNPASARISDLQPGDPAPAIVLPDAVDIADTTALKGQVVVLLFGESHQPRTMAACEEIRVTLSDAHTDQSETVWIAVLAKHSDVDQFVEELGRGPQPDHVVLDSDRSAFGAFGVVVAPTTVVIDRDGRVVHTFKGFNYRFSDNFDYSLRFAHGRMSQEELDQALAGQLPRSRDQQAVHAQRTARLAYRLHRRGMHELAEQKYREALELWPDFDGACIALGALLIDLNRLDEAGNLYLQVLHESPEHHEAIIGLAHICLRREKPELAEAEQLLKKALASRPDSAPANFLMGELHEARGELTEAARRYRLAASLALRSQWPSEPSLPKDSRSTKRGEQ